MATTGALSDYMENAIARWAFFNTQMPTPPTSIYVALFTVAPTDVAGSGTEVTGGSYARQAVTCGTSGTGAGSGWTETTPTTNITNTADITFPVITASWGTVVSVGVFDALSGGNMIARGDLASGIAYTTIGVDQCVIKATTLVLTLD